MRKLIAILGGVLVILFLPIGIFASCLDECPTGSTMIAKYEWEDNTGWVCEVGCGWSCSAITLTGDADSGTWSSSIPVTTTVMKGGTCPLEYLDAQGDTSGSYTKEDFSCTAGGSGEKPQVSHISFCTEQSYIPEFPTIAIPIGITLLAGLFLFRRQ